MRLRTSPSSRSAFVVGAAAVAVVLAYFWLFRRGGNDCGAQPRALQSVFFFVVPALAIVAVWAAALDVVRARPQRWLTAPVAFAVLLAAGLFDFFDVVPCPVF